MAESLTVSPVKYHITAENAAEYARRSAESRKANRRAKLERESNPTLASASNEMLEELEIVNEQIAHTRKVLNDKQKFFCPACERYEMQPQHMAQLLKALDSLLDRRRELLGRPKTGTLKPSAPPPMRRAVIDLEPQPVPCAPESSPAPPENTTMGSGQSDVANVT